LKDQSIHRAFREADLNGAMIEWYGRGCKGTAKVRRSARLSVGEVDFILGLVRRLPAGQWRKHGRTLAGLMQRVSRLAATERGDCRILLERLTADGPARVGAIMAAARAAGFSKKVVEHTKRRLGLVSLVDEAGDAFWGRPSDVRAGYTHHPLSAGARDEHRGDGRTTTADGDRS
jgi:hypothetical protein